MTLTGCLMSTYGRNVTIVILHLVLQQLKELLSTVTTFRLKAHWCAMKQGRLNSNIGPHVLGPLPTPLR